MSLSYGIIIPARYGSSRFPGKPLEDIYGKPMIMRVWERCCKAVDKDKVYIATDDVRIKEVSAAFGAQVVMTSIDCLTGTDRIAEANRLLGFDFVVNVQGDEPLINPDDIKKVIAEYINTQDSVINAFCKITKSENIFSLNLPKVVCSKSNKLLYISRAAIPIIKEGADNEVYKQVCIYAFSKEHLDFFSRSIEKSPLEKREDIEILRFLENDINVRMVEVGVGSIAVDTPEDLSRVELFLRSIG
jgi:3-deoxy-manno-octulosonate cytidylyltransferase (CMP-KDO synthetase)